MKRHGGSAKMSAWHILCWRHMVSESTFIGLVGLIFLLSLVGVLFFLFLSRKLSDAETKIGEEERVLADIRVDNASINNCWIYFG